MCISVLIPCSKTPRFLLRDGRRRTINVERAWILIIFADVARCGPTLREQVVMVRNSIGAGRSITKEVVLCRALPGITTISHFYFPWWALVSNNKCDPFVFRFQNKACWKTIQVNSSLVGFRQQNNFIGLRKRSWLGKISMANVTYEQDPGIFTVLCLG